MTNPGSRPKAVVIGAGFTGLAAAYFLERSGHAVEVYERNPVAGGLIATRATEDGPIETAANAFLNSARVEALFKDLEIPIVGAEPESRARYIFRGGKLRRWPIGFGASFRVVLFFFRYLFARSSVAPRAAESLAAWGRRALGDEATEFLLLPAFRGIYAGDGNRLSASLLLHAIFSPRRRVKPKIRGSVSAPGGMGEVVEKLRARLEERGVVFHFGREGPSTVAGYRTYFCGSAHQTAESLARLAPELSRLLSRIEMIPLVTVTAFFHESGRIAPGFGVLYPPRENFQALGVLFNHAIFPGRVTRPGTRSETWILGGALRPGVTGENNETILAEISADRARIAGETLAPLRYEIQRWVRAIPHYTVELEGILAEISRKNVPASPVRLLGNYLGGVGLTKILDRVAEEIERDLPQ